MPFISNRANKTVNVKTDSDLDLFVTAENVSATRFIKTSRTIIVFFARRRFHMAITAKNITTACFIMAKKQCSASKTSANVWMATNCLMQTVIDVLK